MNDLERKLRQLLEGKQDEQEPEPGVGGFDIPTFALNDNQSIARALGADTLDGKTF